jgi:hypothetical protein
VVDGEGVSNFVSLVAGFESLLLEALPMFDASSFFVVVIVSNLRVGGKQRKMTC